MEKTLLDYSKELEDYFKKNNIKSFEFSQFSDLKPVGRGGYAVVFEAIFEGKKYAIKSLNNNLGFNYDLYRKFRHELKLFYNVENHPNIVKFHGISRDTNSNNFMLVLQYANGGNLREHLLKKQENGVYKISWTELINIAKEITIGLKYLHKKDIIHRDLHSKNILINDGNALITDFGISKRLNGITSTSISSSGVKGMQAYIEPQCYIRIGENIKPDKKSDIYSLGVLFWELTSGIPPFNGFENEMILLQIREGIREKPIDNTPPDYVQLYKKCWSAEPDDRPTLDEILNQLKLLEEAPVKFITNNVIDKQIKSMSDTFSYTKDSNLSNDHNQQEIYAAKGSQPILLDKTEELRKDFNEITCNYRFFFFTPFIVMALKWSF
ncbi:kinase-like domain-containing protein [Gigaspora rosea]|uniref:Kinase-like domain-containing protein n=1 Tax=Gigaspora rosea TaxID=44941 RepID=A0A397UDX5_9GLOM|nr:kinase-like domain-containing protein [Gigaspora rosea]